MHPCAHRRDPAFPAMNGGAGGHWGAHVCAPLTTELETLEKSCWCSEAPGEGGQSGGVELDSVTTTRPVQLVFKSRGGQEGRGAVLCTPGGRVGETLAGPRCGRLPGGPFASLWPLSRPPPPGWRVWESAVGTFLFCVGNGAS